MRSIVSLTVSVLIIASRKDGSNWFVLSQRNDTNISAMQRDETNRTRTFRNISTLDLPVMYRGLFFKEHQLYERLFYQRRIVDDSASDRVFLGQTISNEREIGRPGLPGDGDQCCATEVQLHHLTYLENENGKRYIVSLDDSFSFQYIPIGTCVRHYGICHGRLGRCTVETVARTVLVWTDPELSPPFAFEWFDIPNHCTCRNTYPVT